MSEPTDHKDPIDGFDEQAFQKMLHETGEALQTESTEMAAVATVAHSLALSDALAACAAEAPEKLALLSERTAYRELLCGALVSLMTTHPALACCVARSIPGTPVERLRVVADKIASLFDVDAALIVAEILRP